MAGIGSYDGDDTFVKGDDGSDDGLVISGVDDNGTKRLAVDANISGISPGSDVDFYFEIIKGAVEGHTGNTKYGRIPSFGSNQTRDITPFGDMTWLTSATTLTLSSDDNNDKTSDTGARSVIIYGLDTNWDDISETLNLNGTSNVTTVNSYIRVNRMQVVTCGSSGSNEGTITLKDGSNTIAQIEPSKGSTEQCVYSVPAGKMCYPLNARASVISSSGNGNKQALMEFWVRPFGGAWIQASSEGLDSNGGSVWFYPNLPLQVTAKSDVKITAKSFRNNTSVTAITQYVLVDE